MALVQENLETANESVRWEIAGQIANASAIDAKAIGLLAFMGALAAVLLTIPNGLASTRWLLLLGSVGSSAVVLIGIVATEDLKSGPEIEDFYGRFGGGARDEFHQQLLADFGKTVRTNRQRIEARQNVLTGAFAWAVIWAGVFFFVRVF